MDGDELVHDYLGRLEAASWPLAPGRRAELVGEVREHIETALSEAGRRDDVTVRNVLERLGRPEEIVASEADAEPPPTRWAESRPTVVAAASTWGPVEIAAIFLLTMGAFLLPLFGPAIGLALVWLSSRWTTREKAIATAIIGAIFVLPILGLLAVEGSGTLSQG